MDILLAKELLRSLADGVDPFTGEILPDNSVCNRPDMVRALHCILLELDSKKSEKQKKMPVNAGKPWTKTEEEKLTEEYGDGMKLSAIAKEHGRSTSAIETRLAEMGLAPETYFTRKHNTGRR